MIKAKACDESSRIIEEKLFKLMKEIFDLFDSDGDGLISSKNIDISKVKITLLKNLIFIDSKRNFRIANTFTL